MHYYQPGMTEAQQKALGASLSPAVRHQLLTDAIAALPSCIDQKMYDCAMGNWDKPVVPNCQTISDGWIGGYDQMDKVYDALPLCAAGPSPALLVGAAVATFALGLGVGLLVR